MSKYYIINGQLRKVDDQLCHASKRKNVKYIAKVPVGRGRYRYFYTQEEYNAYRRNKTAKLEQTNSKSKKKAKSKPKKLSEKISGFLKKTLNNVSKIFKKSKKEVKETIEKGKKFVDEVVFGKIKSATKKPRKFKYLQRVKMSNGKYKYFYDFGAYERYVARQKYQKNEPKFMKDVPKISEDVAYTADEDMALVNKGFSRDDKSRSMNCSNCTAAYELRCRGYDVKSAEFKWAASFDNLSTFRFPLYYKNAKQITIDSNGEHYKNPLNPTRLYKKFDYDAKTIEKAILKHSGKNTRGDISVSWKAGSGHSMVYEVDSKGEVTIRDAQTNQIRSAEQLASSVNQVCITRTDNLELRKHILDAVEFNKK